MKRLTVIKITSGCINSHQASLAWVALAPCLTFGLKTYIRLHLKNFPLYLKNFQMCGQTWVAKALLLLPLASTQKLGAGTGSGSCRAFPYRVENVSGFFLLYYSFIDKYFNITSLVRLTGRCAPLKFPAAMNMVIVEQRSFFCPIFVSTCVSPENLCSSRKLGSNRISETAMGSQMG